MFDRSGPSAEGASSSHVAGASQADPARIISNLPPAQGPDPAKNINISNSPAHATNQPASLLQTIRKKIDRSLKREGPAEMSVSGSPREQIPEEMYVIGAQVHKEFITCFFSGRAPPYKQIQNVVNHMWGKGKHIEIHLNSLSNSMTVRVPNDFIRQKFVEKRV